MTKPPLIPLRWRTLSGRAAPIVMVIVALGLSSVLFFFFTAKRMDRTRQLEKQAIARIQSSGESKTAPDPAASAPTAAPVSPPAAPKPEPVKPVFGFARPLDLAKDLAHSLSRQDWDRAGQLATAAAPDEASAKQAADVFAQIQALGFKTAKPEEVEVLGQLDSHTRLSIPFKSADGQTHRLQLDVERDDSMGWKVTQFRLPPALAQSLAALPSPGSPAVPLSAPMSTAPATAADPAKLNPTPQAQVLAAPAAPAATPTPAGSAAPAMSSPAKTTSLFVVETSQDALSFTDGFVRHLLRHDFAQARSYLDESRVNSERLAGLCIVFEEGQYSLLADKPLVMTATAADAAWVIAQVRSDKLDQRTEFGIELQRQAEDQPWRIIGLNLSEILGSFASAASKLGVPYIPIVKNPKGGESLALYFEYDEAGLHPRAQKQLQIVADILKSDTTRRLRIAGHADALGQENYNLHLSRERAMSVKKQLVALGVASEQIDTTGLGTAEPLSPNQKSDGTDDPEGRSKNRRAEIYLDF